MATSFRKRARESAKSSHLKGTKPSVHNAQLLVSTGVPSLDGLLGGGLPVGSVLLIEEDTYGSYSRLILKYFLSEGVMCGHSLLLASASEDPEDMIKDLPGCVSEEHQQLTAIQEDSGGSIPEDEEMKIAWRYQSKPKVQSSFSNQFGHFFDLTMRMDATHVERVEKTYFNAMDISARSSAELYNALRMTIQGAIDAGQFSVGDSSTKHSQSQSNVLRVVLQSLGSPLWLDEGGVPETTPSLPQFLHALRAVMRQSHAVAVVSVPAHLMQDSLHVSRLERLSDAVIYLESFVGSDKEQNPLFRDYHGLFHLHKLPQLNSLVCHLPETLDLAFKLKKKKFLIEKLHLPPELSDTASRPQEDPKTTMPSSVGTGSQTGARAFNLSKKVDF